MFTGRAATPPPEACSVADYGNSFNPDSQERTLDRRRATRDRVAADHRHADGPGADLGAEQLRGRLHVGREHAGGRALEGPPRRSGDRDGARAVVGGRWAIWPGRRRVPRELLALTAPANRQRSNERDARPCDDTASPIEPALPRFSCQHCVTRCRSPSPSSHLLATPNLAARSHQQTNWMVHQGSFIRLWRSRRNSSSSNR